MVIKTGKKTKTLCFLSIYIRDLNLAPIRFVQFVPRFFPRCPLCSFIIFLCLTANVLDLAATQRAYDVVSTSILRWNNIATSTTRYQRRFNVVLKTLHQRYRMDVISTWNQDWCFDVNWQPTFNVVSTLFLGRWINVVEWTLFQRGIRVDFSTSIGNQNSTLFQHCF